MRGICDIGPAPVVDSLGHLHLGHIVGGNLIQHLLGLLQSQIRVFRRLSKGKIGCGLSGIAGTVRSPVGHQIVPSHCGIDLAGIHLQLHILIIVIGNGNAFFVRHRIPQKDSLVLHTGNHRRRRILNHSKRGSNLGLIPTFIGKHHCHLLTAGCCKIRLIDKRDCNLGASRYICHKGLRGKGIHRKTGLVYSRTRRRLFRNFFTGGFPQPRQKQPQTKSQSQAKKDQKESLSAIFLLFTPPAASGCDMSSRRSGHFRITIIAG